MVLPATLKDSLLLSPNPDSSPAWYKNRATDSDNEDESNQRFEFLTGASTPLHINHGKSMMFMSPMKKLDNLHISQLDPPQEDDSEDFEGNKTIASDYTDSDDNELTPAPAYIRKRKHTDLDMVITPSAANHTIPHASSGKMSGIIETSDLKHSFSTSDSTPCPSQPRKKLKFKTSQELTPSQPSKTKTPLLNVSGSRKLSATALPLLSKLNNAQEEDADEESEESQGSSNVFTNAPNPHSTPISQSTPANSRAPSPGFTEEAGVHGYNFVKPTKFKYQTPQSRPTSAYPGFQNSQHLINAYNTNDFTHASGGKYKIVGEFPVTSAGLMNEQDEKLHVGDKRINDPYLAPPPLARNEHKIREAYLQSSDKLPLLLHFERDLSHTEMLLLINDNKSVSAFYEHVNIEGEELFSFLKKERLRWHPDKWVTRQSVFNKPIIDSLSQVINSLLEDL